MQPRWLESAALGGLLVLIATVGLVGLGINSQVRRITEEALSYDIELEDRGDDFRVTVLDMRHYHRNIAFVGPTRRGMVDFESAYRQLLAQIGRLEELGIVDPTAATPAELRQWAEVYYTDFRPAIELYESDPRAFALASDAGLVKIAELEGAAREIEQIGEQRAANALRRVEAAERSARLVLLTVLIGLGFVGVGLVYVINRNNQEKRKAAGELAHALLLRNAFIADASHELRTPLTVLRANAEVGLDLERNCVHREILEEIVAEAVRMTRLIEDLLFLARSDADTVPLELEMVDARALFSDLALRSQVLAQERGVELRQSLGASGTILVDRIRIEQVVMILIDNAIKYAGVNPITLRTATMGQELVVEVIDRGPGIPPQDVDLVFERFYRVDKARSRDMGGTGLGLPIAKSIVEGHKGHILVESTWGEGTAMRFTLPLLDINKITHLPAGPPADEL